MKGIEEKIIDGVKQYRAYFEVDGETHWQPSYGSLSKALNYRDVLERAFPLKSTLPKKVSRSVADPTKVGSAKFTKAAGVAHITGGGYYAYVNINGKKKKKMGFKTADEAYQWRLKFAKEHGIEKINKKSTLSATGYEGVYKREIDYYSAYLKWEGKMYRKSFPTFEEALEYRKYLEEKYWTPRPADIRIKDLTGRRFGRLKVLSKTAQRKNGHLVWHCRCDCGNEVEVVSSYLTSGETRSCGCLNVETDKNNLRDSYNPSSLFLGQEPRKDSSTGYRGVTRYYTRVSEQERYQAWVTVNGKRYYKSGFLTAEAAYFEGRLALEAMYLPKKNKPPEN